MGIFDTHAHYLNEDFGEDRDSVVASLPKKGVELVLAVGYNFESSREELALAQKFDFVYVAAGIHPEYAEKVSDGWLCELEGLLANKKVVALGEIGLDYHYPEPEKAIQKEVFARQLELANTVNIPVIIHSRDACADTLELLKKYKPRGVMHCFSGSAETAMEVVELGLYVSFTGVLTFKNSKKAVAACAAVPTDRLLLETDCPYMAPVPHRGERCDSSMIRFTADKMAEIKGVSTDEIIQITRDNGKRLFGIA